MPELANHVTLSFFRYVGSERMWGMRQMIEMQRPLSRVPGAVFHKLLGTGGGAMGYSFRPDLGTYALLLGWQDGASAERFHAESPLHRAFMHHAGEVYTLQLAPILSRGSWSGRQPFSAVEAPTTLPLAVLTRATIRPGYLLGFWKQVGAVSRSLEAHRQDVLFTKGIGELPWVVQATFSIWRSEEALRRFAYTQGSPHANGIQRTKAAHGFKEDLFARFRVLGSSGTYAGVDPLSHGLRVAREGALTA